MQYIKAFFVGLGIIFFVILLVLAYLWVVDPWNIKPLLQAVTSETTAPAGDTSQGEVTDSKSNEMNNTNGAEAQTSTDASGGMSAEQAEALGSVGLGADAVPTTFTAEQEACFIEVLGAARVEEIKAGAVPTAAEFWAGRGCI